MTARAIAARSPGRVSRPARPRTRCSAAAASPGSRTLVARAMMPALAWERIPSLSAAIVAGSRAARPRARSSSSSAAALDSPSAQDSSSTANSSHASGTGAWVLPGLAAPSAAAPPAGTRGAQPSTPASSPGTIAAQPSARGVFPGPVGLRGAQSSAGRRRISSAVAASLRAAACASTRAHAQITPTISSSAAPGYRSSGPAAAPASPASTGQPGMVSSANPDPKAAAGLACSPGNDAADPGCPGPRRPGAAPTAPHPP